MSADGYAWDLFPTEETPQVRRRRQRWPIILFAILIAAVAAAAVVGSRRVAAPSTAPTVVLPCAIVGEVLAGSTGPDAACVEAALHARGYTVSFDAAISAAEGDEIVRFQSANGRTPDGVVGERTAESLGVVWAG